MTAIALASAKGAPGVTTSALLLAAVWPRPACLVEADPRGGDLRYWQTDTNGQPLRPDTGVVSLLAQRRSGVPDKKVTPTAGGLLSHTQILAGGLPVLIGVSTPRQHQALASSWTALSTELNTGAALIGAIDSKTVTAPGLHAEADHSAAVVSGAGMGTDGGYDDTVDVVVDVGGLTGDQATLELLHTVAMVLFVCEPTVSSLAHTRDALTMLRSSRPHPDRRLGVVIIGSTADRDAVQQVLAEEVTQGTLFVGQLAADPVAARGLAGTWTRRLDRSPLVASGRRLATDLHAQLQQVPRGREAASDVGALVGQGR